MVEFVRVCPRCGTANPEYENLCRKCNHFIGMEAAIDSAQAPAPAERSQSQGPRAERSRSQGDPRLQLTVPGTSIAFAVKNGDLLGQAHSQSEAQMQLPETVPDVAFVHRRHCRFLLEGGQWYLEAVDQTPLGQGFTNPTWLNGVRLEPGERRPLGNGDDLRLSATTLLVAIRHGTVA
jgi:hypothetical protein